MIGITGATGEIGGRLARRLAERGYDQRLIVRDAARAPALDGAETVKFGGYSDTAGMYRSCTGVSLLFLASAREAEDRVEQHKAAIDAAAAAGVTRIVYLSLISAASDATFTFARDHFQTEEHIRASGLDFTFSRQSLYLDLVPLLGGPDGVIRGPAGNGRLAPVSRDDIADALVAMLTERGHESATYDLTGPQALTLTEVAAEVSKFSDEPVIFQNETLDEAYASRASYAAPDWELAGWISTYTAIAAGEFDVVTDHVERLTGHPPIGVPAFLSRYMQR
ncbi:MAG: SDR family oxidoreductase [Actinomycetota bacterium]|nr:SDR family oxidoreductase [Geodermatophilaceae bacterium]MDQ3505131.1 SDR family oxidoreductase [Actinomycetota bacterium]